MRAITIEAVCACVLVSLLGCTATIGYRYADWLVLWKLDQYFDITADQKVFLKERLHAFLLWHRKEALPGYETFLRQVKDKTQDGLTHEEVEWAFMTYQHLRAELFERLVPEGVAFLRRVDEPQIRHLEWMFRKDQEEITAFLTKKAETRLAQRATRTIDWLQDWLGPLAEEQEQRIRHWSLALPDLQQARLAYLAHRHREVVQLLYSKPDQETLTRHLRTWLVHPTLDAPPVYRVLIERMQRDVQQMVLSVDRILTIEQRAHALTKLQDLIDDVHELATS